MVNYNSIESIREVFFEVFPDGRAPNWALYAGKGRASYPVGKVAFNNLIFKYNQGGDLSESWSILERRLRTFAERGGYAHLYLGDQEEFFNVPIFFPHKGDQDNAAYPVQYQGVPGVTGFPGYGFNQVLEDKIKMYELERKIDDLEHSQVGGIWDRVFENLLESGKFAEIAAYLLKAFAAPKTGQIPPVQVSGSYQTDANQKQQFTPTQNIGENFIGAIAHNFQDERELSESLQTIAGIFNSDPEGMKALIRNIKDQENAG